MARRGRGIGRDGGFPCPGAWITKIQINELRQRGVTTVKGLASLSLSLASAIRRNGLIAADDVSQGGNVGAIRMAALHWLIELLGITDQHHRRCRLGHGQHFRQRHLGASRGAVVRFTAQSQRRPLRFDRQEHEINEQGGSDVGFCHQSD
jgi:hypothetical protein